MEIMALGSFGERLRILRSLRDMTQSEAAEHIGVSLRYYQSLESDSSQPSVETLMKALSGLRVTFDEFFDIPKPPEEMSRKSIIEMLSRQEDEIDALKEKLAAVEKAYKKLKASPWVEAFERAGLESQGVAMAMLLGDQNTPTPVADAKALLLGEPASGDLKKRSSG